MRTPLAGFTRARGHPELELQVPRPCCELCDLCARVCRPCEHFVKAGRGHRFDQQLSQNSGWRRLTTASTCLQQTCCWCALHLAHPPAVACYHGEPQSQHADTARKQRRKLCMQQRTAQQVQYLQHVTQRKRTQHLVSSSSSKFAPA